MRTLKKTLALVLVLAMMFSLCAVSASADFTDADEITYTEAADVMAMIGVIDGMPDGSFDAKGTLTRAQAAVMITRLLGAEDYAIATKGEFADVAASHWAAGAISFCVEAGIVEGYGDGNFGPNDTLTGYQWAKMLLCALGYNAAAEGMTGAAWQINVAKLAKAEKLFAGNDKADKTVAATREEAAHYALNLLSLSTKAAPPSPLATSPSPPAANWKTPMFPSWLSTSRSSPARRAKATMLTNSAVPATLGF